MPDMFLERHSGLKMPPPVVWSAAIPLVAAAVALLLAELLPALARIAHNDGESRAVIPERIITIAPNSAEIICALGACDRIAAVSKFCVHPPELQKRPRIGGLFDPNLEKIIALRPDLVVLRGTNDSVEQLCRQRGIPIHYDRTETLAGVKVCVTALGRRLDRVEEAAALVRRFQDRLDAIRERTAGRPRPRVLLTISRQTDRLANVLTAGKGSFPDEMLSIAGGANVFGHLDMAYPQVSTEAIVVHRPQVIIELLPEVSLTPQLERRMLEQWEALGPIPAVADGRVFFMTDDNCLIPSPRYVEIVEKVSRLLHPEDGHGR